MSAIDVDNVSKQFRLYTDRAGSVKELFTKFGRPKYEDFWAVRDVSLTVPEGSVHGLIGHNGCGKSTLLRMMAGIHKPTKGKVTTTGRVSALLELGAGFHPELTGRENVYLNASILGLSKKQTDAVYDRVVTFSGLEAFMDSPVKHYSSGMFVRLGFSVAVHVEPQILLVDEVIAVGDEDFQRRCLDHLASLKKQGVTIVLVSHAMGTMQNLCDHITWMDHGQVRQSGDPVEVTGAYLHEVNEREAERNAAEHGPTEQSADAGTAVDLEFFDRNGQRIEFARTGEPLAVRMPVGATAGDVHALLSVESESGIVVGSTRTLSTLRTRDGAVECTLDPFTLGPGNYVVAFELFDDDGSRNATHSARTPLQVRSEGRSVEGMVELPASWGVVDRGPSRG